MSDFLIALGLVFVIEGLVFAAFPHAAKRAIVNVLETPEHLLRLVGIPQPDREYQKRRPAADLVCLTPEAAAPIVHAARPWLRPRSSPAKPNSRDKGASALTTVLRPRTVVPKS